MDLDGDLDVFVATYGNFYGSPLPPADPSHLYENLGDGTFVDRGDELPEEAHDGYTFVPTWVDLNDDLYPELYLVNDHGDSFENLLLLKGGTF